MQVCTTTLLCFFHYSIFSRPGEPGRSMLGHGISMAMIDTQTFSTVQAAVLMRADRGDRQSFGDSRRMLIVENLDHSTRQKMVGSSKVSSQSRSACLYRPHWSCQELPLGNGSNVSTRGLYTVRNLKGSSCSLPIRHCAIAARLNSHERYTTFTT